MIGPEQNGKEQDSLVDEVRAIRRNILAQNGNDLVRLYADLKRTEAEFKARTGPFALMRQGPSAQEVTRGWPHPRASLT